MCGCQMDNDHGLTQYEKAQSVRKSLTSGRTESEIKEFYATLPFEEQKLLWLDKFDQVKNENLSISIDTEMDNIIFLLKNADKYEQLFEEDFKE